MDGRLVSLLILTWGFLLVLATDYAAHGRVPVRSIQTSSNSAEKSVSLATGRTNPKDVLGLNAWRSSFVWLWPSWRLMSNDPCLPQPWSGVECNSDANPRVIALFLGKQDLLARYLPDFSSMDALEIIDLHGNHFYGAIPSFLGEFPDLKVLDLADNDFEGLVPDSLVCNANLELRLYGNNGLYQSGKQCRTPSDTKLVPPPPSPPSSSGDAVPPSSGSDTSESPPPTNTDTLSSGGGTFGPPPPTNTGTRSSSSGTLGSPPPVNTDTRSSGNGTSESPPPKSSDTRSSGSGNYGSPPTNTDTRSGGSETNESLPTNTRSRTFESPRTNVDTSSGGSFEVPGLINIKNKHKKKLLKILKGVASAVFGSWTIGAIFALFRCWRGRN